MGISRRRVSVFLLVFISKRNIFLEMETNLSSPSSLRFRVRVGGRLSPPPSANILDSCRLPSDSLHHQSPGAQTIRPAVPLHRLSVKRVPVLHHSHFWLRYGLCRRLVTSMPANNFPPSSEQNYNWMFKDIKTKLCFVEHNIVQIRKAALYIGGSKGSSRKIKREIRTLFNLSGVILSKIEVKWDAAKLSVIPKHRD